MSLARLPCWEDALHTYIDRMADEPFRWGSNDCALFAAGAVRAMTGVDPAEAFRGIYSDRIGAARALREHGQGTLLRTVEAWLGPAKHVAGAHRGDVVMRDRGTLGVCVGPYSWFLGEEPGRAGLVCWPTRDCARAFTVPYALEQKLLQSTPS